MKKKKPGHKRGTPVLKQGLVWPSFVIALQSKSIIKGLSADASTLPKPQTQGIKKAVTMLGATLFCYNYRANKKTWSTKSESYYN